ncbi:Uncharacterized protein APZ42_010837 [Daphnia magna]|uniref:Tyr recombinase domain-containing protein n=1 Tax=Daphnia magna TaxID=35525 RepID=A0A162TDF7_9CRUS|nr:Uncharacterized protein APZ42_010837 [Daphnia magna]
MPWSHSLAEHRRSRSAMMDNVTAFNYVNKEGDTKLAILNDISQRIISWCEIRSVSFHAVCLPGALNREADFQFRAHLDASDWRLDPTVFLRISCHWVLSIDLFASAWNRQLEILLSWHPQPVAHVIDAFSLDWHHMQAYAFPSFSLIQPCLGKNQERPSRADVGSALLANAAMVPLSLRAGMQEAITYSTRRGPSSRPGRTPTPLLSYGGLLLTVWWLSGVIMRQEAFRSYDFRSQVHGNRLLLGLKPPHKSVGASTVARWIKEVLASAGIKTKMFSAHSTRRVAVSKAFAAGIPVERFLKAGSWVAESFFSKHFQRPVN